jgi:hypothetical protein
MPQNFSSVVENLDLANAAPDLEYFRKQIIAIKLVKGYAAKRIQDGLEALLLVVDVSVLQGIEWPRSDGFKVDTAAVGPDRGSETRISLQLTDTRYRDIFLALSDDICDVLIEASSAAELITALLTRLIRWQEFLKRHRSEGLSDNQRVGLFGELFILRNFFMAYYDPSESVLAWRGCKKAEQDFQFPENAMEIKATRATIPEKVSISNIQQLDDKNINQLFLTVVHLTESPVSGETLPELLSSIRGMLPDHIHGKFDEGLFEVGYLDSQAELYANSNYQVQSINYHKVEDGFPRLQLSELPDGVKGVSYEISLDAARPFQVTEEQARTMMFEQEID